MEAALWIFDLDGTISNVEQRVHYLHEKSDPYRWTKFYAECDKDEPFPAVVRLIRHLIAMGDEVMIFTGREETVREKTLAWLETHVYYDYPWDDYLQMRREGDHTEDDALKKRWLEDLPPHERGRVLGVFEDRKRVVDMWRREGVFCAQVAPGDF